MKTYQILGALLVTWAGAISTANADQTVEQAKAVLNPTQGNTATGVVTFTQEPGGVKIVADISGLTPGKHGFHIHEFGDCSAPDAASAGAHFNPFSQPHSGPEDKMRHEGDMGNVEADASGKAHYEFVDDLLTFQGPGSILGHSVIVHQDPDDLHSQPSGNSGARVACGIIGLVK